MLSVIVTKSPDEVMVILLGGVIVYPLGAAGTRPGIVCGFNLLTASGTEWEKMLRKVCEWERERERERENITTNSTITLDKSQSH